MKTESISDLIERNEKHKYQAKWFNGKTLWL